MKSNIYISLLSALLLLGSCGKDEVRVTYPASTPEITSISIKETDVYYGDSLKGDSITLNVSIKDKIPLSVLIVNVVVSNKLMAKETIRTMANEATVSYRFGLPFLAGMPDGKVKVYVTARNVEMFDRDTVISSVNGHRPQMKELYVVPSTITAGLKTYTLPLVDGDNYIYGSDQVDYPREFSYFLASKKTPFGRVDWSQPVFGVVDGKIGIVTDDTSPILASQPGLVSISQLTFDALSFEMKESGKALEPITDLDVNKELKASPAELGGVASQFRGATIYFGKGTETTFSGFATLNMNNGISPDYFEVTANNKAKFLGETGMYKAYYHIAGDYLYIEPLSGTIYPDVLWACGNGIGRPSSPYTITSSWNWNSPLDYFACRKVSAGVYQATLFLKSSDAVAPSSFGSLDFKFFNQRGWDGGELKSGDYVVDLPLMNSVVEGKVGNWCGQPEAFEGVYQITLDMNAKKTIVKKIK